MRLTVDAEGALLGSASYEPWEQIEVGSAAPFGFTGELQQDDLVYLCAVVSCREWYLALNLNNQGLKPSRIVVSAGFTSIARVCFCYGLGARGCDELVGILQDYGVRLQARAGWNLPELENIKLALEALKDAARWSISRFKEVTIHTWNGSISDVVFIHNLYSNGGNAVSDPATFTTTFDGGAIGMKLELQGRQTEMPALAHI